MVARRRLAVALAIGVAAAGPALLTSGDSMTAGGEPPPPAAPALEVGEPRALRDSPLALWTNLRRRATARAAPGGSAPAVATLGERTPEGTANTVLVLGRERRAGRVWVRVRLAVLPNGTTGWVPRGALGAYHVVRTRLHVDLARLRLTLLRDGRELLRAPVAVGRRRFPTPRGRFYVRNRLEHFGSSFYGPLAFGTSARSSVLTDWPGGGFVGIHGTDRPELVPGRVSHGCIRMRNPDIVRLGRLMPVGTPITIS